MAPTNNKADASFPATIDPAALLDIPNSFSIVGKFTTVSPLTIIPERKFSQLFTYFCCKSQTKNSDILTKKQHDLPEVLYFS